MIDIIEELSTDEGWILRFCAACPAISRIPATLGTPAEEDCPCYREPFHYRGCIKQGDIDQIGNAAEEFYRAAAIERAVA